MTFTATRNRKQMRYNYLIEQIDAYAAVVMELNEQLGELRLANGRGCLGETAYEEAIEDFLSRINALDAEADAIEAWCEANAARLY